MPNFEGTPRGQIRNLESETLDAIRDGSALPLPSFLYESSEAKSAFTEALQKSQELKESLALLSPEDKLSFIKVFQEALETHNPTPINVALLTFGATTTGMGAATYGNLSENLGIVFASALGVIAILDVAYNVVKDSSQRSTLKKLILSSVTE